MKGWINNIYSRPESDIPVLVFLPFEPEGEKIQVKLYHSDTDSWSDTNLDYWSSNDYVSHWMYLPKKPK